MDHRFRWLQMAPFARRQVATVAAAMKARAYSRESQNGFLLTTVRSEFVEGTYIERVQFVEKLRDPLGGEVSLNRVEFRQIDFRLSVGFPQLELRNASRSVKPLLNHIASALDFKVAISGIRIGPLDWVAAIESQGVSVQITALRSNRFPLTASVLAAIQLSGAQDVRAHLRTLIGNRSVGVDAVVCGWQGETGVWKVELRTSGVAEVFSAPGDTPEAKLREALRSVPRKTQA